MKYYTCTSPLLQTKKQYEKTSEEAENAMHTLEKADNDPNSTKAKIDKVQTMVYPHKHIYTHGCAQRGQCISNIGEKKKE